MKTFVFLGQVFDSDRVATLVRTSGALIKIKASDLVSDSAKLVTDSWTTPCVIHHENKYHALSIPQDFKPGEELAARLISKPALKRFRAGV